MNDFTGIDGRKLAVDTKLEYLSTAPYIKRNGPEHTLEWFDGEWDLYKAARKSGKIGKEYDDYETNPIQYKINKFGYRGEYDEMSVSDYGLAVGSSHTWGSGLHIEDRFDSVITKQIGIPIVNIGQSGSSPNYVADQITVFALNMKAKPKFVIIEWPPLTRFTIYSVYSEHMINAHNTGLRHEIWRNLVDFDINVFYAEAAQAYYIVNKTLANHDIFCYNWTITPDAASVFNLENQPYLDYARDGSHPGRITNQDIAAKFLKNYK